jgi:hypothetical protein
VDYKEISELMRWLAVYGDLNGSEARLAMFLSTSANYKTSKVSVSYSELAQSVGLSKASVIKSIARLVEMKVLHIEEAASGRMQTSYRVRSADELTKYFIQESSNPECDIHYETKQKLFGHLIEKMDSIGEGCEDCTEEQPCSVHAYRKKQFADSIEYREYTMWLADNPKPNYKIKTILGKKVIEE